MQFCVHGVPCVPCMVLELEGFVFSPQFLHPCAHTYSNLSRSSSISSSRSSSSSSSSSSSRSSSSSGSSSGSSSS